MVADEDQERTEPPPPPPTDPPTGEPAEQPAELPAGEEGLPPPAFPGFRESAERRRHGVIDELAAARREQELSQTVVAARMGTSQSVVARLEAGAADVRLSTLERYAAAVGRDLDLHLLPRTNTDPARGELT